MTSIKKLFDNNLEWVRKVKEDNPLFFQEQAQQQRPEYLWIGCSDSRVSANEIIGMSPGDIFVHRNVANLVVHTDLNCLSVIQYAVEVLKVKHVIVCGHYGCGGVETALGNKPHGLIDNWLRHIKDVYHLHQDRFDHITDSKERLDLLCEFNVGEQVSNVCHTTIVQEAWRRGQDLTIHGWIYSMYDGVLHDLGVNFNAPEQVPEHYRHD